jgi:hypothetical protein
MNSPSYLRLSTTERQRFTETRFGFLTGVQVNLARSGIAKSLAAISRTWMGYTRNPDARVVAELEAEYSRRRDPRARRVWPVRGAVKTPAARATSEGITLAPAGKLIGDVADSQGARGPHQKPPAPRTGTGDSQVGLTDEQRLAIAERVETQRKEKELRDQEKREQRQASLREKVQMRHEEEQKESRLRETLKGTILGEAFMTIQEVATILGLSRSTAARLFRNEPGVLALRAPGSRYTTIRVPASVVERFIKRKSVGGLGSRS